MVIKEMNIDSMS